VQRDYFHTVSLVYANIEKKRLKNKTPGILVPGVLLESIKIIE